MCSFNYVIQVAIHYFVHLICGIIKIVLPLHYNKLEGDKEGLESVRVNDQYRIEFKTNQIVSETVVTICNIKELSNHYK